MYTGALENWPPLVAEMARLRPLWGNDEKALALARDPWAVAALLYDATLPCPPCCERPDDVPAGGRWLLKPRASAGGAGIRLWRGGAARKPPRKLSQYSRADDAPVFESQYSMMLSSSSSRVNVVSGAPAWSVHA